MAKTPASTLVTNILRAMGRNPGAVADGSNERVDALAQLNRSNQDILIQHSLRFMLTTGTLAVVGSTCAVPATIDPAKTMTLSRVSGDGEIPYKHIDAWYTEDIDTYGQGFAQTEPFAYTVVGGNFLFKPAALTATVPYIAQLLVTAMTDGTGSFSQLPEGWENSLLALDAEAELRRVDGDPGWKEMKSAADELRERLYGSERSSKLYAKTSREVQERKVEKAQLSDEAMP